MNWEAGEKMVEEQAQSHERQRAVCEQKTQRDCEGLQREWETLTQMCQRQEASW